MAVDGNLLGVGIQSTYALFSTIRGFAFKYHTRSAEAQCLFPGSKWLINSPYRICELIGHNRGNSYSILVIRRVYIQEVVYQIL